MLAEEKEPLKLERFIHTALLFSGIEYNNIDILKSRIFEGLEKFGEYWVSKKQKGATDDKKALGEEILLYLHGRFFKTYSMWQTRIDVLLETGQYNCVSSAIMYMIFAKYMGLRVDGVRTRDHAFCRVVIDGKSYDVETTSPYGFEPGRKIEFKNSFGKITGYAYVPPKDYNSRWVVGDKEMLALILFNRNAFLTNNREFLKALRPAVDAYGYIRSKEAMEKLLLSVNNLASWYGIRGRDREGIDFLKRVLDIYRIAEIKNGVVNTFRKLFYNYVIDLVDSGNFSGANDELKSGEALNYLSSSDRTTLFIYLYQRWAFSVSKEDGYFEASRVILDGIKVVGKNRVLLKNYETYIHNYFVTLVKSNRLSEANRVLREALRYYSSSPVLRNDLRYVELKLSPP